MNPRWRRLVMLAALGSVALTSMATAADAVPGSQGVDTSIPPTDSAVTASGRGAFASLRVTVNQTANLTNQAVSVTWTGATPTLASQTNFASNFVQVMQCWGEDDGTVPENPGPAPENCVFGAVRGDGPFAPEGDARTRVISRSTDPNFDPTIGVEDRAGRVWRSFVPADGRAAVGGHYDYDCNPEASSCSPWINSYFNSVTTNEIVASRTFDDGTGAELFEVHTALENSGLGCGLPVQPVAGGGTKEPQCWLVVVPRGLNDVENVGTVFTERTGVGTSTSPLSPAAWANRVAIPLEFISLESPCSINDAARRISGADLGIGAISSWQPELCQAQGLPPFTYASVADDVARQQLARGSTGMIAVSRPYADTSVIDRANPIIYSPLTISGLTIAFTYERSARGSASPEALELSATRLGELNLTPRLVAKLLTQSYGGQIPANQRPEGYTWLDDNPNTLANDQDFIRFNPEFEFYGSARRAFSGLSLPSGNSDAAVSVWEWILADPEAAAWLAGAPDEWGMRVNPWYSTNAATNPGSVAFASTPPNLFSKADPYCYQAPSFVTAKEIVPPPLCFQDWNPYARSYGDAARVARVAFDGAKIVIDPFASENNKAWRADDPQNPGVRAVLSLTDVPSATKFGLQQARLSRAGDNGDGRTFIAPDAASMTAGVGAMTARDGTGILQPNHAAAAPAAYPLTMLTYAAYAPLGLSAEERADYAGFLAFVAEDGQTPGLERGNLPPGYVPLTEAMRAEAALGAVIMATLQPQPAPALPVDPTTPTSTPPGANVVTPTATGSSSLPGVFGSTTNSNSSTAQSNSGTTSGSSSITPTAPTTPTPTPTADGAAVGDPATGDEAATAAPPGPVVATSALGTPTALTPDLGTGVNKLAFPIAGFIATLGVLVAYEITKRPRRLPAPIAGTVPA